MKLLRLTTSRLGEVREISSYLNSLAAAYENIYAFDLIVQDAKARYGEDLLELRRGARSTKSPMGRRTVLRIRDLSALVLTEDRLQLRSVAVQSPGFWEFVGALNPLDTIRKYLQDRHERQKDRSYRSTLEAERMAIENDKLKIDVVQDKIILLKQLGIPEDQIREIATRRLVEPLRELDRAQDVGLVETAEFVDADDSEDSGIKGTE